MKVPELLLPGKAGRWPYPAGEPCSALGPGKAPCLWLQVPWTPALENSVSCPAQGPVHPREQEREEEEEGKEARGEEGVWNWRGEVSELRSDLH